MECHPGCHACCVAPRISSDLPGMNGGKPAHTRCVNLESNGLCRVYEKRPAVCRNFMPQVEYCGHNSDEAFSILTDMEKKTALV